ncbi:MAG: YgjV family protein [Pseudomonadota bacterium]|nr:YgjV family protein [Pseudomonadota bacterium]
MLHPEFHPLSVAQAWGFVRFPVVILMYASRRDWVLRLCGGVVCACGAVHFYLLGVLTAALTAVLQGTRIAMPPLPHNEPMRRRQWWAVAYAVGFLTLAIVSFQGWLSVLAATLSWASTCMFLLLRDRSLRLRLMQLEFGWLTFGFLSHSHSQVLISLTVIPIMAYRISTMPRTATA